MDNQAPIQTIGWLRVVRELNDAGARVGVFVTTERCEPVGFGFGHTSLRNGDDEREIASLVCALIESTVSEEATLIGLLEETPSVLNRAIRVSHSLIRMPAAAMEVVRLPSQDDAFDDLNLTPFLNELAEGDGLPTAIASSLAQQDRPFEPLIRVSKALAVAFEDLHIQSLVEHSGLWMILNLPDPETPEKTSSTNDKRGSHLGSEFDPQEREGSLTERLWSILATRVALGTRGRREPVVDWWRDLMPFQRDGVRALIELDRLLLADDMGLGKTVQAIVALRILVARRAIHAALVVAPAGLLDQWRSELTRWAPELTAIVIRGSAHDRAWQWRATSDITFVSYDSLRSDAAQLERLRSEKRVWDVVVLDEAQRIKNRNRTSDAAKRLARKRSWALTGTPIENDEEDLASIMEFVDYDPAEPDRRFKPGLELAERHRELQLRRKKTDVLSDLPPKLETKLAVGLTPSQRISYDKAELEGIVYLKSLGSEVAVTHVLELITRLKQICNVDPRTRASSKLEDIDERLDELTARGYKALVFSQYTSESSGVRAAATYLNRFKPLLLTGDMAMDRRREIISQFQTDSSSKVLILSLRAGGLGLNLQVASYVFHLDRWWNPAIERQAEDRTHRMGQTGKVNVFKYCCENTIEQRIDQILERKRALFDELVDDISIDLSTRLTRQELLNLFDLND